MAAHAFLSASSSHIWLNCPPAVRLWQNIQDKGSEYARRGTDAHTLCQYKVEKALGRKVVSPVSDLTFYDEEMEEESEDYAAYIMNVIENIKDDAPDPLVFVEQRVDFSKYVQEGFGTADCLIVEEDGIYVIDYKSGNTFVEAKNNSQLLCYALGAYEMFKDLFDIKQIAMVIYQPKRDNISCHVIELEDLLKWAKEVLAPTAALAYKGQGEFKAGDHCRFCRVKNTCRARAEYNLELAKYDFKQPALLEACEIGVILTRADELTTWASDIKEFALKAALSGTKFPGYKVVAGRAIRKYTNEEDVAKAVEAEGFNPYEQKLLGITAMTAVLGKKRFEEILGPLVYKPEGKPTLVPISDKRKELNLANEDFKEN